MKKVIRISIYVLSSIVLLFGLFLLVFTILDYRPEKIELIYENNEASAIDSKKEYSFLLWNIGFCGLGSDMDFFYDGGEMVFTTEERFNENLDNVLKTISNHDSVDFILLQEVDKYSKRSFYKNQYNELTDLLNKHNSFFALNYNVSFVPIPLSSPLGRVTSGLATFSRSEPSKAERYQFPGNYSWPKSLFMLDRCFMVTRYKLDNDKDFVIVNTHNSAYDDGSLKAMQMKYLKDFLIAEYEEGNYILVGGDWNQSPPDYTIDENIAGRTEKFENHNIEEGFMPEDWTWVYDASVSTNRMLYEPYKDGETSTTILDFYLISPNIESTFVKTLDLKFQHSDHQPVLAKFRLL
jgi:endonuclease/exonuclease/phosphatase family metal-dependent hydrolase